MVQKYDIESIYLTTADYNNLTNDIEVTATGLEPRTN